MWDKAYGLETASPGGFPRKPLVKHSLLIERKCEQIFNVKKKRNQQLLWILIC